MQRKMSLSLVAVAASAFLLAGTARISRAEIAYLWPAGQAGAQAFSGSIGMDFTVNQPINITSLGVFDHLGDGISGTLTTTIWNLSTGTAVPGAVMTFNNADPGALIGSARFKPIPTITLPPGSYSVASSGHGNPDFDYNPAINTVTNNGGGAITISGGRRFRGDATGGFPATVDAGGFYGGGTFEFTGVPIPPANFNGDLVAYQVQAPQSGIQDFGGSVGMDFIVHEPIYVTALGAFDADQNGFNLPITIELYARNDGGTPDNPADDTGGALLANRTFSGAGDSLVGASRFAELDARIRLEPGAYTVNAHGYGAAELLANSGGGFPILRRTNTGDGALSFVGTGRFGAAGAFPGTPDAGPADRYAAGSFAFAPVPEPSTWALAVSGIALLGWQVRRRR
jgi:hypothetical protein